MKERNKNLRIVQGRVVSDAMDKTRVILLETFYTHPKFRKIVKVSRRLKIHDERNESKKDDIVQAVETRPLSRQKRHRLFKIIQRGQI
ncbi:MAG: 30S ribosomal protein S17 [Leptonema illini]|jgi:small subunit ribosomal protein S17|uniref:Small ribosomal subunit protein uS17 n=2 Tax=Leptonema illini TaxID=183 RepID=H2CAN5_9LEPT|nr:30S ribosomal protein S17 [Leptonema illini]EHQ08413.1 SSU ribosomal protein S17P [Leptonema illini DSM 21528]KAB2930201.1 MAG: 30S ribosomal protein S17 [Leptonema illini]PKL34094.1 MAG: 30S ribosomal protein S17 [Spirochaetae bacterium HGW-Spirochaetae-10]